MIYEGDEIYNIISNKELIALNQDPLGIQAKRIYMTYEEREDWDNEPEELCRPDKAYIRDNDRVDVLAKALADGRMALSFINLSDEKRDEPITVDRFRILSYLGDKVVNPDKIRNAHAIEVKNLWTGEVKRLEGEEFSVSGIEPHDNVTLLVTALD